MNKNLHHEREMMHHYHLIKSGISPQPSGSLGNQVETKEEKTPISYFSSQQQENSEEDDDQLLLKQALALSLMQEEIENRDLDEEGDDANPGSGSSLLPQTNPLQDMLQKLPQQLFCKIIDYIMRMINRSLCAVSTKFGEKRFNYQGGKNESYETSFRDNFHKQLLALHSSIALSMSNDHRAPDVITAGATERVKQLAPSPNSQALTSFAQNNQPVSSISFDTNQIQTLAQRLLTNDSVHSNQEERIILVGSAYILNNALPLWNDTQNNDQLVKYLYNSIRNTVSSNAVDEPTKEKYKEAIDQIAIQYQLATTFTMPAGPASDLAHGLSKPVTQEDQQVSRSMQERLADILYTCAKGRIHNLNSNQVDKNEIRFENKIFKRLKNTENNQWNQYLIQSLFPKSISTFDIMNFNSSINNFLLSDQNIQLYLYQNNTASLQQTEFVEYMKKKLLISQTNGQMLHWIDLPLLMIWVAKLYQGKNKNAFIITQKQKGNVFNCIGFYCKGDKQACYINPYIQINDSDLNSENHFFYYEYATNQLEVIQPILSPNELHTTPIRFSQMPAQTDVNEIAILNIKHTHLPQKDNQFIYTLMDYDFHLPFILEEDKFTQLMKHLPSQFLASGDNHAFLPKMMLHCCIKGFLTKESLSHIKTMYDFYSNNTFLKNSVYDINNNGLNYVDEIKKAYEILEKIEPFIQANDQTDPFISIGDIFADRNGFDDVSCAFFTMLYEKKCNLKLLIGNHDLSAIVAHVLGLNQFFDYNLNDISEFRYYLASDAQLAGLLLFFTEPHCKSAAFTYLLQQEQQNKMENDFVNILFPKMDLFYYTKQYIFAHALIGSQHIEELLMSIQELQKNNLVDFSTDAQLDANIKNIPKKRIDLVQLDIEEVIILINTAMHFILLNLRGKILNLRRQETKNNKEKIDLLLAQFNQYDRFLSALVSTTWEREDSQNPVVSWGKEIAVIHGHHPTAFSLDNLAGKLFDPSICQAPITDRLLFKRALTQAP